MASPSLVDLGPVARVALAGVVLAAGPLAWIWLRHRGGTPSGRLRATIEPMHAPGAGAAATLVVLALETPRHLARLDRVLALDLSPRRREIALAAARGDSRREAAARLDLGEEAMKKHLAIVYAATDTHSWEELIAFFT